MEVRSMEEVIAVEAARVREEMNARTPLVDLRTSATGEKPAEQARLPTPRYLIGMRVYESGFPRMSLVGNSVNKGNPPYHARTTLGSYARGALY